MKKTTMLRKMVSSNSDSQANLRLEYELIHRVRMAWSESMMRWRQISFRAPFQVQ